MQWNIADLPIFASVVKHGGISSASRALRMPKSSISRFIQRLENDLQVRLFERNSRQMRMTREGEVFYKHCQLILEQIDSADAHMNGLTEQPNGKLNVSLPMAFSRLIFSKHIALFHQRYPDITLYISISPTPVDLIGDHIDVAVQVGVLPDSDLVAVPLIDSKLVWVAAADTAKKLATITSMADLVALVVVAEKRYNRTPLKVRFHQETTQITLTATIETTDPIMVKDAILSGLGVGLLPEIYCQEALAQGDLVEVAQQIALEARATSSAVYTSKRMLNARTRAFIDFLKEICRRD